MLSKIRKRKRKKYQYGGGYNKYNFPPPKVQHGNSMDALEEKQQTMKEQANEQVEDNKMGGVKPMNAEDQNEQVVVPQSDAAGPGGNEATANIIGKIGQSGADAEFDKEAPKLPKDKSGGKKTRRKRRKKKRKRKTKKKRRRYSRKKRRKRRRKKTRRK